MAGFSSRLARLRRFLRDPDALIHTTAQLQRYWEHAEVEFASKTGCLERAESYPYPSRFLWATAQGWEQGHVSGDSYSPLPDWGVGGYAVCYPWEPAWSFSSAGPADEGTRVVQPWEGAYVTPSDALPVLLSDKHLRTIFAAYDQTVIEATSRRAIAEEDGRYQRREGKTFAYYPIDETERLVALYPQPPIVLDDLTDAEVYDDAAGVSTWQEDLTETSGYGLTQDTVETANTLFLVYEAIPRPIDDIYEDSIFPEHLLPYVEAGCLERAFGADTDGYSPTLRDYWRARKEAGIEIAKRWKITRMADQTFILGGPRRLPRGRSLRLPDGYPAC